MIKQSTVKSMKHCIDEVLPNGLTVYLLPKNDYHKTYGLFSTNYGSIDNEFIPYGATEK